MDIEDATVMFDALSQETRLKAFRLLVQAGHDGLPAGTLSDGLGVPHNTMSFHLSQLSGAGLVTSRKQGRMVIYAANLEIVRDLIGFMVKDCCSGELANIREDRQTGCAVIELTDFCKPTTM